MHRIKVKIDSIERRKKSTGLLHVLAGFYLLPNAAAWSQLMEYKNLAQVIPVFLVALASLVYGFFRKKIDPRAAYNHWLRLAQFIVYAILGLALTAYNNDWITISLFAWALVTLLVMFTERAIFHETSIQLKNEGVQIPGYFAAATIPWNVIEDFVARPDYITIFKSNQTYVQIEVTQAIPQNEITAINNFAKSRIQQNPEPVLS